MATIVPKDGSTVNLPFFMTLASDHVSPATGLSPTVTISKNCGAFASPAGAVTEIANGWYKLAGNATDSNTAGPLVLHASAGTADNSEAIFDCQDVVSTVDGLTLTSLFEVILAVLAGKATYSSGTITYYKQDGSTSKLQIVASETNGSRAAGGTIT